MGADLALSLIDQGQVQTPWIFNTDADAQLPNGYFSVPGDIAARVSTSIGSTSMSAVVYPFFHETEDQAAAAYDCFLRYQTLGLRWAGSPYAYGALGSCIAVSANHYAAVRGFPPRAAGEDFYLLNKLAKTGTIWCADTSPLQLGDRPSERVPFGTGPRVKRIREGFAKGVPFTVYPPKLIVPSNRSMAPFVPGPRRQNTTTPSRSV